MSSWSRTLSALALAAPSLLLCSAAPAQSMLPVITGTIDGQVFGCTDPADNQVINISFTIGGGGAGTTTDISFTIDFPGSGPQTISVPITTADVQALVDALTSIGSASFSIPAIDVGFGCLFEATLTFQGIGGIDNINPKIIPSNVLTTQAGIDAFLRSLPVANASRIRSVLSGGGNGVSASARGVSLSGMSAAGGDAPPVGAWAGYAYTDTENDFISTAFTSKRHSVQVGLDTMPGDDMLLGVSVGLERTRVKTAFNTGEQTITAITVAPYFGMLLSDWLSFDLTAGISDVHNDQFRSLGGQRITSDVESLRFFASGNLAASYAYDALRLTGQAGLLWATQRDDDFRESNGLIIPETSFNVGRFLLGGEVAYSAGAWEPYVSGLFEHDFTRTRQRFATGIPTPKNDDSDLLLSVGLRYFGGDDISGSVEFSTLLGRRNLDEESISANLRWQF